MHINSSDNIYPIGQIIRARTNPLLPLVIYKYFQRIYYCSVVDDPNHKHFAYFEHELLPPEVPIAVI